MTTAKRLTAVVAVLLLAAAGHTRAADPPPTTTKITVPDLECASCAKKLAAKLVEVPGVAKAEPDVAGKTVKVTHKGGEAPSPKALWEASEKGGQVPSKMEGPGGTFTAKPTK